MPSISEILQREIGKVGKSKTYVASQLEVSEKTIENYMRGLRQPKPEALVKLSKLLGFSLSELSEDGEQFVPHEKNGYPKSRIAAEKFLNDRREQKGIAKPYMVPLVPVKAQAGYAMSYPDTQHFSESLEKYPMLPGISYQGAEWRYFEVEGDSMIPTLFDKDYILVSAVLREDWQDVKPNKPYVVVLHEDVFVKFIYQVDRETWILASANRKVKHKKIAVEDVKELWVFRGRTTKNLDIPKIEIKV